MARLAGLTEWFNSSELSLYPMGNAKRNEKYQP
jgi:hypothetical protein